MKALLIASLGFSLVSCEAPPPTPAEARFQIERADRRGAPGPVVWLLTDTETGAQFLLNNEWIQPLPRKAERIEK